VRRWHGLVAFVFITVVLIVLVKFASKPQGCSPRDDSCAVGCP
jgi:hypothetical protein